MFEIGKTSKRAGPNVRSDSNGLTPKLAKEVGFPNEWWLLWKTKNIG